MIQFNLHLNKMRVTKSIARQLVLQSGTPRFEKTASRTLDLIGVLVAGEAKELIVRRSPSVGRRLRYSGTGRARVVYPAMRGFPPNSDTGTLMNSIHHQREGINVYVGSTVKYSKYLENPEQLDRPFLVPALKNQRPAVDRLLTVFMKDLMGASFNPEFKFWKPGKVSYAG